MKSRFATGLVCAAVLFIFQPATAASLKTCVSGIKRAAIKAGVSRSVANRAFKGVKFDEKAVRFSRTQPEYKTPIWDYMAFLVDTERINDGRAVMKKHGRTLARIEKAYGVDAHIIAALWGVESDYGKARGDFFLPHALANVACFGRKGKYFRSELIQVLKLVTRGDVSLRDLYGSWAGAFGQTQFMPSTYQRLAVDFDRDGKRDLVHSVPDALASAANFLKKSGWRAGRSWGFEVRIPKAYKGPSGRRKRAALSAWASRGVRRINGKSLSGKTSAALILPAGRGGPAFLVTRNFNALYSYNAAISYALAISHLSDRLKGSGPIKTRWPVSEPGLSRKERLEVQKRLIAKGYDIGEADGRIGPLTMAAIKKVQQKNGMKPTGRPSRKVLRALQ